MPARTVVEYVTQDETSPFGRWFEGLDGAAAPRLRRPFIEWSRGICLIQRWSGKACGSIGSISDPDTAFTTAMTALS